MSERKMEPIWVESCMTRAEWKIRYQSGLGSSTTKEPPAYDPEHYTGGSWRRGMGSTPTPKEMEIQNNMIESLRKFHLKKKENEEQIS
jgi:hypothetical protein